MEQIVWKCLSVMESCCNCGPAQQKRWKANFSTPLSLFSLASVSGKRKSRESIREETTTGKNNIIVGNTR